MQPYLERLNDFDPNVRQSALEYLMVQHGGSLPASGGNVNMHCHSFFSYHAEGWSPSRIAWEARKAGWYAAALCDFDVLDGLEEFLSAARRVGLRAAVHLETRAFVPEWRDRDINSPGEPGVTYIMGGGFTRLPAPDSESGATLDRLRRAAGRRNEALVRRIRAALPEIPFDYARDVLPLTPAGVATERHIVSAYVDKVQAILPDETRRNAFWVRLLKLSEPREAATLAAGRTLLEERVRGALAKRGGLGYRQPDETTFPPVDEFIAWVRGCGAIPLITWLDGTSPGEDDCEGLLDLFMDKGCAALNIIPDRNWKGATPEDTQRKSAKLEEIVRQAQRRHLPINIGTEMNRAGLPSVDDLDGAGLSAYRKAFLQGAQIMVGHTLLAGFAELPYNGEDAAAEFPDVAKRNAFYATVGAQPPLTPVEAVKLREAGPEKARTLLVDRARHEQTGG